MPRPGYEADDDATPKGDDILSGFDPETRAELQARIDKGGLTQKHVVELYRLLSVTPEERDVESVAELLDATEGMDADEFRTWVDDRITRWKDQ